MKNLIIAAIVLSCFAGCTSHGSSTEVVTVDSVKIDSVMVDSVKIDSVKVDSVKVIDSVKSK